MHMNARIGINGYGRIGRLAMRAAWEMAGIEIVHVNELAADSATAAHLTEFDSVHGRWGHECGSENNALMIDGTRIGYTSHADPSAIDWREPGVDIVIESTGVFKTPQAIAPHFDNGARKVIVAAPVKDRALNIVMGVNDAEYDPSRHNLLTAASCTTNCLAPIVKVIHENLCIKRGVITTVHDVTNTQVVVDAPHKDLRRARSALNSLIPTSTGSATAITMIYPELTGKLNGMAIRVPLLNASLIDCVFQVSRDTNVEEINALFESAAQGELKGILGYETRPLVSVDYVNDPRSCIIDAPSTMVVDRRMVKIYAWYDNEWGYVNRMMELAQKVAAGLADDERSTAHA
ncbi:MAG: glyceraldehyde 3-phosphate dehydrogenase [Gammaproteobacteria bacterium]|jgi:glyceraldehyde 3-phosphate dehydrogenase